MRRIRVAFFAEILFSDFDGASRTMFQLLDRIDTAQFEFLFICGSGPDRIGEFDCIKVPAVPIPLNPKYRISLPFLKEQELLATIDNFAPHVVHIATPSMLGHFALDYAVGRGIPVISIYHTHFISYIRYYFKYLPFLIRGIENLLTTRQNRFYAACSRTYVPSVSLAAELVEAGMQPDNLKIWQRGIDTALFSPFKRDPGYLSQITGNKLPTLLFASRLVWEKNLETLIAIYDRLQLTGMACNWIIAGDGSARKECMSRMPGAIFLGQLDHDTLSVLYASANVFVFPSVSETFGNVVLEAMASGLVPVIADGGGSKDMILNGVNGFTCNPDDPDDYVDKIMSLLADPALREQLAANAVQSAAKFDWEELAQVYFGDLRELAAVENENVRV